MSNDARRLAAMVDAPDDERSDLGVRRDFATLTRKLFESFGAPLAGMSDAPFADVLRVMASFPTYSLGNQALIALQAPGSQCLSGEARWAELGRRLVNRARAIHIWAPTDNRDRGAQSVNGYERPSLDRAETIALSLGLRAAAEGSYRFDAQVVRENALWGKAQTWRAIEAIRLSDAGDHIAVNLTLIDGRIFEQRARTAVGLVKILMQSEAAPNDETIAAYLNQNVGRTQAQDDPGQRGRDFFQKFRLVPVFDVSETDGPPLPDPPAVDLAEALAHLIAYCERETVRVVVSDNQFGMHGAGEQATIYLDAKDGVQEQFASLVGAVLDIVGERRALTQKRELLNIEREAIGFVLSAHFGWPAVAPELGRGLAHNVEPHATAEVVKARLVSIHDIAKEIILAARPGYENPLLKALTQGRAPEPVVEVAATLAGQIGPTAAAGRKLEPPKSRMRSQVSSVAAAAGSAVSADFNPFATEPSAVEDPEAFNPFAACSAS